MYIIFMVCLLLLLLLSFLTYVYVTPVISKKEQYKISKEPFPNLPPASDKNYTLSTVKGTNLLQIQALRDIPRFNVKRGDLGGMVEGENNLSQTGNAWIGVGSVVEGHCFVKSGFVEGVSKLIGNVRVVDSYVNNSEISGSVLIIKESVLEGVGIAETEGRTFSIVDSSIYDTVFSGVNGKLSHIEKSMIGNAEFKSDVVFLNTHLKSVKARFCKSVNVNHSDILVDELDAEGYLELYNVKIKGKLLETENNVQIKSNESGILDDKLVSLRGEDVYLNNVEITGFANILGELSIVNSSFKGEVTLSMEKGEIRNLTLEDFSSIEMGKGIIENCHLMGFSKITQWAGEKRHAVENLVMRDDEHLEIMG